MVNSGHPTTNLV